MYRNVYLRLLPEDASRWTGAPSLPWGRRAAPSQLSAGGSVLRLLPRHSYTLYCPHRSTLEKHTYRLPRVLPYLCVDRSLLPWDGGWAEKKPSAS